MIPNEHQRAAELFHKILELPAGERQTVLENESSGDSDLRARVERLLAADEQASNGVFLERPALYDAARLIASPVLGSLPPAGTVLGNYRLGERVGEGGMGVVYQAEDLHLARRVAVKILIQPASPEGKERIQRFQREARAAGQLNHPHIAAIYDAGLDHDFYYIAMEFVEGRTLRALLAAESRFIDSKTVLEIVSQTASALSAAHAAGIIHRDIKPENIMVRPDGFVKVLDFGLASVRDPSYGSGSDLRTQPGRLAGTTYYLSPEQVLGKPAIARSDLFSLGVVAYELATGVRPFEGLSDGAIFDAILHRDPPPPSTIRPALGHDLDDLVMGALEKDPDLRFQNASDVRSYCRRLTRGSISTPVGLERAGVAAAIAKRIGRRVRLWPLLAAGLLCLFFAAFFWLSRPLPAPHVTHITQITHDGLPKDFFVNDGARLYYAAGSRDPDFRMFEVSVKGGEPVSMPLLAGKFPLDISADGSEMLLGQYHEGSLWVAATLGGRPRRIGELKSENARWSPKGDEIVYCTGPELRIARSDTSQSRVLVRVGGYARYPAWSPDGQSIRFTSEAKNSPTLWEVAADGTHLRALFPESEDMAREQGTWTPNGKYFLFSARQTTQDLWAIVQPSRFSIRSSNLVRLTNGPLRADRPQPSSDGRRIFFRGRLDRGELVRYDRKLYEWLPHLQGLAATQLDYSRDSKWIAYISYPEGSVWRSALDGGDRLQLTTPPLFARNPRFSPDGAEIVFYGGKPGEPDRLYLVSTAGGAVRQLTHGATGPGGDDDGSWSADGNSIVFCAQFDELASERLGLALGVIDMKSGRSAKLPGSEGLWSARWSPNGQYIAGMGYPQNRVWLYSLATRQRRQLTTMAASWPSWSSDSQYIQFAHDTEWYRVRIRDGKVERVLSLSNLKTAEGSLGWLGLTPDGSLISTRDVGSTEIYALDWETP